jgi:hypothetical protein
MVKNVIPPENISRGITFLYMRKVAITLRSTSYIPKSEHQGWFIRTTFFYPLHADLLRRQLERGEKSKPLTLVFLHVSQQAGGQSAALGLATESPSPTLDNDMLAMYNEGVGDILQAT